MSYKLWRYRTLYYRHLNIVEYVSGLFVHVSEGYISYTNKAVKAHYWFDIVPSQFLQRSFVQQDCVIISCPAQFGLQVFSVVNESKPRDNFSGHSHPSSLEPWGTDNDHVSIDDACRSTRIILRVGNVVVLGPFGIQQNNLARISISQEHVPLLRNCEMIRIKFRFRIQW